LYKLKLTKHQDQDVCYSRRKRKTDQRILSGYSLRDCKPCP